MTRESHGAVGAGFAARRPRRRASPSESRRHNRTLLLQTLLDEGPQSRADLARATSLTRVSVSDLVASLVDDGLIVEVGQQDAARPGKPGTLIDVARTARQTIGIDLSGSSVLRGALLDLDGTEVRAVEVDLDDATGDAAVQKVIDLARVLVQAATAPLLGVGIGTPGVVDGDGVVRQAPNLGWHDLPLRERLAGALDGVPVHVVNDADAAVLAERALRQQDDLLLVRVGRGVGAGLVVGGGLVRGAASAAGEIGHVTVGTDGGPACACGRHGCLESWLSEPHLTAALDAESTDVGRARVLEEAGRRLGIVLAPIVGALNLPLVVMSGPEALLEGAVVDATARTLRERILGESGAELVIAMTQHGDDVVVQGAAALVRSAELGVS